MYLGSMIELSSKNDIYTNPLHPYTQALLSSITIADPRLRRKRIVLSGDIPSPSNPPQGCKFHTRCPYAKEICKIQVPQLLDKGNNHLVACHLI